MTDVEILLTSILICTTSGAYIAAVMLDREWVERCLEDSVFARTTLIAALLLFAVGLMALARALT